MEIKREETDWWWSIQGQKIMKPISWQRLWYSFCYWSTGTMWGMGWCFVMCIGMLSSPKIGGRMSNSEFGIQSWMMIMMKKRSKYCECNKVKEQREDKREKKEIVWREWKLCQYKVYGELQVVRNDVKPTIHTSHSPESTQHSKPPSPSVGFSTCVPIGQWPNPMTPPWQPPRPPTLLLEK